MGRELFFYLFSVRSFCKLLRALVQRRADVTADVPNAAEQLHCSARMARVHISTHAHAARV